MGLIKKIKKLVSIPQSFAASNKEQYVRDYLMSRNPKLKKDGFGNIGIINVGKPLICAHMDTVQSSTEVDKVKKGGASIFIGEVSRGFGGTGIKTLEKIMSAPHQLGFDDKAGIAIAMQLYEDLGDEVSILFTCGEETGLNGARYFAKENLEALTSVPYCIVPDRKGGTDVLGHTSHGYCSKEFETDVMKFLKPRGFSTATGSCCDANVFKEHINCINISCGYYNAHQSTDWLSIGEFENTFEAIKELVTNYTKKLPPHKTVYGGSFSNSAIKTFQNASTHNYGGAGFTGEDDRYDDYGGSPSSMELRGKKAKKKISDTEKKSIVKARELITMNAKDREMDVKKTIVLYTMNGKNTYKIQPGNYNFCEVTGTL